MDKYYYFVSQLPGLKFSEKPSVDTDYFLAEAKKWLGSSEFDAVSQVNLDNFFNRKTDPRILKDYKSFEREVRNEIVLARKAKGQKISYQPRAEFKLPLDEKSPLELEKKLLLFRWRFIEEKELEHNFDLGWLILYFLKLQILDRLFTFEKEKGISRFDQLSEVNPVRDKSFVGLTSNRVKL